MIVDVTTMPDGRSWRVGDTTFVFGYERDSTADRFRIRKPAELVELYAELAARFRGARIVELGIAAGGSTALMALLMEPELLIACELDPEPVAGLAQFIEARGLVPVVKPFYGVDQADGPRLAQLVDDASGGRRLDLVVDDASHRYHETRSSFEVLFPRLRPGGLFIIEDWAADYAYAERIEAALRDPSATGAALQQRLGKAVADHPGGLEPLPRIAVELLHVCGGSADVVGSLSVNRYWIGVERGSAELDPAAFRLSDHYRDRWGWLAG